MNVNRRKDGSDLYRSAGVLSSIKVHGTMITIKQQILSSDEFRKPASTIMNKEQAEEFRLWPEINLAVDEPEIG